MQKQYFKGLVTKSENGKYKVLASTSAVDRQGDSIDQAGWDISNFKLNPVMPWAHDYSALPIAKATSIAVTQRGLEAEFEFAPEEGNPMAQQVKVLYDNGYLNAVSVGFIPKERKGMVISKAELLEISFVPVPANQEALRLSFKSIDDNNTLDDSLRAILKQTLEKGAVTDEMNAEEVWESKWKNWEEVQDIISALWKVYFDEATPVENFGALLAETITLLQAIPNEVPADTAETDAIKTAILPENTKAFADFMAKSGRTLSKKTLDNISKAITSMKDATTVLEELTAASSENQDGNGDDSSAESEEVDETPLEEKGIVFSNEDMVIIRQTLVAKDKTNELALSIVNNYMKSVGIK